MTMNSLQVFKVSFYPGSSLLLLNTKDGILIQGGLNSKREELDDPRYLRCLDSVTKFFHNYYLQPVKLPSFIAIKKECFFR